MDSNSSVLSVSASLTCTSWNHSAFGYSGCWRALCLHHPPARAGRTSVKITSASSLSLSQLGTVPLRHRWSTNLCLTLVLSILLLPLGSSASLELGHEVVGAGLCCRSTSWHSACPKKDFHPLCGAGATRVSRQAVSESSPGGAFLDKPRLSWFSALLWSCRWSSIKA